MCPQLCWLCTWSWRKLRNVIFGTRSTAETNKHHILAGLFHQTLASIRTNYWWLFCLNRQICGCLFWRSAVTIVSQEWEKQKNRSRWKASWVLWTKTHTVSLAILCQHYHSCHVLSSGRVAAFYWPLFSLAVSCSDWIYLPGYDLLCPAATFLPHPVAGALFPRYLPCLQ